MTVSQISTHILNTATGRPAVGVGVVLEGTSGSVRDPGRQATVEWETIASAVSDENGRVAALGPSELAPGEYRLRFDTGSYFARSSVETFFPEVNLTFMVGRADQHYHVPLLISPFGYSTYRGN